MELITKNPYTRFKVPLEETNRGFLTNDELSRIENKTITIERLDTFGNIFVLACYTGLSYSDILKLNTDHLRKGIDNKDWIIIDRSKNEQSVQNSCTP